MMIKPLVVVVKISAPITVPVMRPTPPVNAAPPITTAAIASSSPPYPDVGAPEPSRQ